MNETESSWHAEKELLLVAAGLQRVPPIKSIDLDTGVRVAVAAYLAVEETWAERDCLEVLRACEAFIEDPDPSVAAAVAVRGAMLDTWWVRGPENPNAWDRAITWAKLAVALKPEWVLGWLVLFDGYVFRGELDAARAAAEQTVTLRQPIMSSSLERAVETLFGGRINWSPAYALELIAKVRAMRDGEDHETENAPP